MQLTPELSRAAKRRRLGRLVSDHTPRNRPDVNRASPDSATAATYPPPRRKLRRQPGCTAGTDRSGA